LGGKKEKEEGKNEPASGGVRAAVVAEFIAALDVEGPAS
jgi:hypothetical protein